MSTSSVEQDHTLENLYLVLVEKIEQKEFELPPLPQVASQVLAVTSDPNADAPRLTALIQKDPILAAKIFQTSNSAALGASREIESLQQAIAWLGINTVASTAFTLSVQSGIFNVHGYEREVKGLWVHMLTTAFYAKSIAGLIGRNADTAFLSGLLHAIGKPLIVHTVNQNQKDATSPLPWAVIETTIKESYVEVGRQLAQAWNFPDPVKEAINLHQDLSFQLATSPTKSAPITCLSRHFASYFLDETGHSEETIRNLPVIHELKIQGDVVDALLDNYSTIQTQVKGMLS